MNPTTLTPTTTPSTRPERLTGQPVFDAMGEPTQPSHALPFKPLTSVPTMLVNRELNYLHWLASTLHGTGRVVELGCFLGGSTSALVAGKELNALSNKPILTYDAFEIPQTTDQRAINCMQLFELKPGQCFRPQFDRHNRGWLDRVIIRQGWLPLNADKSQEYEIYPEQEPIELLFVDIAKAWDVHRTVLRTFARHLFPGATLVHQDFFDAQTPWIPLHMFQLREVLEPLDSIYDTPSLSFQCRSDPAPMLANLWTESDLADRQTRRQVWQQVRDYWQDFLGSDAVGFLYGHEAMHAIIAADADEAVRSGRLYEAWGRSSCSRDIYHTCDWDQIVSSMPDELAIHGVRSKAAAFLAAECAARGPRSSQSLTDEHRSYCPLKPRHALWQSTLNCLADAGHHRIALFGGGKHTKWLLNDYNLGNSIEIACIIDDHPTESSIQGIDLVTPSNAHNYLDEVTAILPSSDAYETQLIERIEDLFSERNLETYRVYTDPMANDPNEPNGLYTVELPNTPGTPPRPLPKDAVQRSPGHRPALGLPPERSWIESFAKRYALPDWPTGYVSHLEAAFLWDLIEAIRPVNTVEIGTASGISTAMLLGAVNHFCTDDALVHSYDIGTRCYFDSNRPIASAIGEMAPELLHRARLHANSVAVDAASCFETASLDFAFIDADHGHPAPTIDLLSLIYALKPNTWVALHDIELSKLQSESGVREWTDTTGAERLFKAWPFEKVQLAGETPNERNIGAIRMPNDPADAIPCLVSLLEGPWETYSPSRAAIDNAMQRLKDLNT